MFNDDGKVIGITSSGIVEAENIGFAISVDKLVELYNKWDKRSSTLLGSAYSWDTQGFINTPTVEPTSSPTPKPTSTPSFNTPDASTTVYYAKNGTYYHINKNCKELDGKAKYAVSSAYAASHGFKPCPTCISGAKNNQLTIPLTVNTPNISSNVYYAKNGTYYHIDKNCKELNGKAKYCVSPAYAESHGFKPCPTCVNGTKSNQSSASIQVYYSNNGSFYHYNKNCKNLNNNKTLYCVSEPYAKNKGYLPCPICTH